jgi:hypothetical protein
MSQAAKLSGVHNGFQGEIIANTVRSVDGDPPFRLIPRWARGAKLQASRWLFVARWRPAYV